MKDYKRDVKNRYMSKVSTAAPSLYYKASGKVSPAAPFLTFIYLAIAAVIAGPVYAYFTVYNPIELFNLLATLIYAGVLSVALIMGLEAGKVRSPLFGNVLGIIGGAFGLWVSWLMWVYAHQNRIGIDAVLFVNPLHLWDQITIIAQEGAWKILGWWPTGAWLYGFWIFEAITIVAISILVAGSHPDTAPYCERCNKWAHEMFTGDLKVAPIDDADGFKTRLEHGDVTAVHDLGEASEEYYTKFGLKVCPQCRDIGYLDVELRKEPPPASEDEYAEISYLMSNLIIDPTGIEEVIKLARREKVEFHDKMRKHYPHFFLDEDFETESDEQEEAGSPDDYGTGDPLK